MNERVMRDINSRRVFERPVDTSEWVPEITIDRVTDSGVCAGDDEKLAEMLFDNCFDAIKSMFETDPDETKNEPARCTHDNVRVHEKDGCESCFDCGESFVVLTSETQWMDGFRDGTHCVRRKHIYERRTYFLTNLRGFFAQTNIRTPPAYIITWAKSQSAKDGRELLECMKNAPVEIRKSLDLPRHYKHAPSIFQFMGECTPDLLFDDTEQKVMRLYDGCSRAFDELKTEFKRKSFFNKYYVMWQLLNLVGVERRILDRIPAMRMKSKTDAHDDDWRRICEYLGWKFVPFDG